MTSFKIFINLFIAILLVTVCENRTDKTLVDKEKGKDVVEAVQYLMRVSAIFAEDNGFMVRMAYVATHFGEDSDTFTTKLNIWGLTQTKFEVTKDTKTHPTLTAIYAKISQQFNIDWTKIQLADLSKPLIGGLAVNLILAVNQPVPLYLEEQGTYYNKVFSSATSVQTFSEMVINMEKLDKCFGRMDLAIVLDGSGSIGASDFKLAKEFVSSLVDTFSLVTVNVGLVVYSSVSTIVFPLSSNLSLRDMKTKIDKTDYPGENTNTSGAIRVAKEMFKASHRADSPKIMAIFTDGAPDDEKLAVAAAKDALRSNITLFAVGIGSGIKQAILLSMVEGKANRVFSMSSYKSLSESFGLINTETCKISQKPQIGTIAVNTLTKGERRYFCFDLTTVGISVSIEVKAGKFVAFWSYTRENPSSALNDGEINGHTFIAYNKSNRACVTVEGLETQNNFTITGNKGGVSPTTTSAPTDTTTENNDECDRKEKCCCGTTTGKFCFNSGQITGKCAINDPNALYECEDADYPAKFLRICGGTRKCYLLTKGDNSTAFCPV